MIEMYYRELGTTGLKVSAVGLGGGSSSRFGLVRKGDQQDVQRLVDHALDLGITLFDSSGAAQGTDAPLAAALANRRNKALISTKVHVGPWLPGQQGGMAKLTNKASAKLSSISGVMISAKGLRRRVETTLRELRTDYIDILSLHAIPPKNYTKISNRLAPELLKLKDEGKVRAIGLSETVLGDPQHEMAQMALKDPFADVILVAVGPCRPSAIRSVLPEAKQKGVSVLGMFAARDALTSEAKLASWLTTKCEMQQSDADEMAKSVAQELTDCGFNSMAAAAYRFASDQDGVSSMLVGTANPKHLSESVSTILDANLSSAKLLAIFDRLPIPDHLK